MNPSPLRGRATAAATTTLLLVPLLLLGATPAHAAAGDFTLDVMSDDDARAVETEGATGDDGGFTAITTTHVLVTGDDGLGAYSHDLAAPGVPCDAAAMTWQGVCDDVKVDNLQAGLFSDVKTRTAYLFDLSEGESGTGVVTGFWPLAADGTLADRETSRVELSQSITMSSTSDCTVTASGWGRAVIWDTCAGALYDIALPSGTVSVDDSAPTQADFGADFGTIWGGSEAMDPIEVESHGVAEVIDGRVWLALATGGRSIARSIVRYGVQEETPATELIRELPSDVDLYGFAVSPQDGMWCAHMEGYTSAFPEVVDLSEPVYCAALTATVPSDAPAPDGGDSDGGSTGGVETDGAPELAETGPAEMDLAILAALVLLVTGGVLIARQWGEKLSD